jgi:hypothetical protein
MQIHKCKLIAQEERDPELVKYVGPVAEHTTETLKNCHGSVLLPQPPLTENLMTETILQDEREKSRICKNHKHN